MLIFRLLKQHEHISCIISSLDKKCQAKIVLVLRPESCFLNNAFFESTLEMLWGLVYHSNKTRKKPLDFQVVGNPLKGVFFIGNYIYCSPYNSRGMSWTIGFFWKLDYIQQESCYNYGIFLQHLPQFCFVELLCFCYA